MLLFFTAARVVVFGREIKRLEEGHAVLTRQAFAMLDNDRWPEGTDLSLIILGNQRSDLPRLRPDGSIGLWGLADGLFRAQILNKYHHGMRQSWQHPTRNLNRVQLALYRRFYSALTTPDIIAACERLGGAMHTLQDSYTISHTTRADNGNPYSPLLRLHYSPSRAHPFISPDDRVWGDAERTRLTPSAAAAVQATRAAFILWSGLWGGEDEAIRAALSDFINTYLPIEGQTFNPPT